MLENEFERDYPYNMCEFYFMIDFDRCIHLLRKILNVQLFAFADVHFRSPVD